MTIRAAHVEEMDRYSRLAYGEVYINKNQPVAKLGTYKFGDMRITIENSRSFSKIDLDSPYFKAQVFDTSNTQRNLIKFLPFLPLSRLDLLTRRALKPSLFFVLYVKYCKPFISARYDYVSN